MVEDVVDVCSYCNTAVFARALDSATHGRLIATEEQGRRELEIERQHCIERLRALREGAEAEQRQRTTALWIVGVVLGLVALILIIK